MLIHASKTKTWQLAPEPACDVGALARGLGITPAAAKLLAGRGYDTVEAARAFIGKETAMLHDPFLMADMDKAVARIREALVKREKIVIYGDYDVDGVTSTTILYSFLRIHSADVRYYIPNRIGEGYGVNIEALRSFAADGCTLMITVDTGITAIDEIAAAKALGLDTVVTDHHECRAELPAACAVVNPRRPDCPYPFKELAGCGVAFKLISALEMNLRSTSLYNAVKFAANRFGELVAIGTIADVMPLRDENRIIVSYGLGLLERTKDIGISALMRASGLIVTEPDGNIVRKKITSSSVGFTLAPRINAAGRISSAEIAVELFLTEDRVRADQIAAELCETNRRRQAEENAIIEDAMKKLPEQCAPDDHVIVLADDHWHHGVIGIVCSRLTEKYNLPSILVSFEGQEGGSDSDVGKGSGRSIHGLNLVEALAACEKTLLKYGGHELAAGLSVERGRLDDFRRAINEYAAKLLGEEELSRVIEIDEMLEPCEISLQLAHELYLLEPFGISNAQPVFESDRMLITEITPLAGGKHTRLTLSAATEAHMLYTALLFGTPTAEFPHRAGDLVDVVYNLDINDFRGRQTVQLLVRDIRRHAETADTPQRVPTRDDFAALYLKLKNLRDGEHIVCDIAELVASVGFDADTVSVMLDVFAELAFIRVKRGARLDITLLPIKGKIALENSRIYMRLQGQGM